MIQASLTCSWLTSDGAVFPTATWRTTGCTMTARKESTEGVRSTLGTIIDLLKLVVWSIVITSC